jgi:hypothetical protein
MARSVARSSRNTNGVEARAWHKINPPMLKMSIGPGTSSPSAARITRLSQPRSAHQEDPGDGETGVAPATETERREPDFASGKIGALDHARPNPMANTTATVPTTKMKGIGQDAGDD